MAFISYFFYPPLTLDWSDDNWPTWDWSEVGVLGLTDPEVVKIKDRLCDLKEELNQLNSGGGRLVFVSTLTSQCVRACMYVPVVTCCPSATLSVKMMILLVMDTAWIYQQIWQLAAV